MRILIVDENADFRTVLSEYLREGLAAAANSARKAKREAPAGLAVKEWNPATQGIPQEGKGGFKWNFDVVLIDSHIEPADPVEWLTAAKRGVPLQKVILTDNDALDLVEHAFHQRRDVAAVAQLVVHDSLSVIALPTALRMAVCRPRRLRFRSSRRNRCR